MDTIYVSEAGLQQMRAKLEKASQELKDLQDEKAHAYSTAGDGWHDNPYFNHLLQEEERKSRQVSEMKRLVSRAHVFTPSVRNTSRVRLGSIVEVSRNDKEAGSASQEVWEIVGYGETDMSQRKLAYNSPIAESLLGLAPGESTLFDDKVEYRVVNLYSDWTEINATTKSG